MLSFIPFLCPFDDILIGIVLGVLGVLGWYKNRKWCKKKCICSCHSDKKDVK